MNNNQERSEGEAMSEIESDGARLARLGVDAELWAKEMAATAQRIVGRDEHPSEHEAALAKLLTDGESGAWLHVWLCAAIETGRSDGAAWEARTGQYARGMAAALGDDWRSVAASSGGGS